jgi:hypothetical protein
MEKIRRSSSASRPRNSPNRGPAVACATLLVLACASTKPHVTEQDISGPQPKPDRILVFDFAYSPEQVRLDRGLSAEIVEAAKREPRTAQERAVGQKVADAVAKSLVAEIRKMGLPAERASGQPTPEGHTVSVEGQFLSIDEGNRTERIVIGLGAGRTTVDTAVQVYQDSLYGELVLEKLDVAAKSGRKPGAAETMGVGAAMGHLVVSSAVTAASAVEGESFGSNVDADAERTGKSIAKELRKLFAREGWVNE